MSSLPRKSARFALKIILKTHSFCYRLAGSLAQKVEEDGLHPKHCLMDYHKFFVDNTEPHDIVLDIGCGNGALACDLFKKQKGSLELI